MLDDFLTRAALAGVGVALAAGPLGCFVVWRRMAYFGDATAHAAILGVALALALNISIFVGVIAISLLMAATVSGLSERGVAMDTILGVLAHTALAAGLVAVSFLVGVRMDLVGYLFGDILAVRPADLLVIYGGAALVIGLLAWRWSALLTSTLNPDLAGASGIHAGREQLVLTLALAITVAVALKVVGALLIASMLIIPAAAARPLASSPEAMAVLAAAIGAIAALSGLWGSFQFDTPTGPTIVVAASTLFAGTMVFGAIRRSALRHLARAPRPGHG